MKNYVKEGQKLPLYGIGPSLVWGMAAIVLTAVLLFCYVLKWGLLSGGWIYLFRTAGIIMLLSGLLIWIMGVLRSDMDNSIADNRLKTDGIYACVRNPMYSGLWLLMSGVSFMWHDFLLIPVMILNWGLMTVVLKRTEEKWLQDLYGEEYEQYKKKVNRIIPWKSKQI